ncbi:MAG: hypothetical protein HZC02_01675 [Candidatus Levybacteria bacterium]|nr:hypothetical protein [Candidatus Levybacteria bacterium]
MFNWIPSQVSPLLAVPRILVHSSPHLGTSPSSEDLYTVRSYDNDGSEYQIFKSPLVSAPFFVVHDIPLFIFENPFNFPVTLRVEHDESPVLINDNLEVILSVGEVIGFDPELLKATSLSFSEGLSGTLTFFFSHADNQDEIGLSLLGDMNPQLIEDACRLHDGEEVQYSIFYMHPKTMIDLLEKQPEEERLFDVVIGIAYLVGPGGHSAIRNIPGFVSTTNDEDMIIKMFYSTQLVC